MEQTIYSSNFIKITRKNNEYFIESFEKGLSFEVLKEIINGIPRINITNFMALRNAIFNAPLSKEKFAEGVERIAIEITPDELKAYITLAVLDLELSGEARARLAREILDVLKADGIIYGIDHSTILGDLKNGQRYLIAQGESPKNGIDAIVKRYELKEIKPEVKDDGNVDHYELSLINKVQKGDWLGEQIYATEGVPGKTVKGETIVPMPGKNYRWVYDRASVEEVKEEGKSVLRALKSGAVHYDGEKVIVSNHLEVDGDIDFRTGNIDFDGFLTVKGSIADSFIVNADKDIEIKGDYGIGAVKEISSRGGNIYIKGGIAGKGRAVIKSRKNIFTKFVSDATIYCEGSVHIGFYCFNSTIYAKEVILDSPRGQIIGGNINAEIRVVSPTIGSTAEKRTVITVSGFNRNELKKKLDSATEKSEEIKNDLYKAKQEIIVYSTTPNGLLNKKQLEDFEEANERYDKLKEELILIEQERKILTGYLKAHGEGEISILKKVYPNTFLEIKKQAKEIMTDVLSAVFYYTDGEIKQL